MDSLKAVRDQERAARRRERPDRGAVGEDLPDVSGTAACAHCGTRVGNHDVIFHDDGGLCPACYGHAESVAAAGALPGWIPRTAWRMVRTVPLALVAPLVGMLLPFVHNALLLLALLVIVALTGAVPLLQSFKEVRSAWITPMQDGEIDRAELVSAALGLLCALWPWAAMVAMAYGTVGTAL